MSDCKLVQSSEIIITGTFIGNTQAIVTNKKMPSHLGAIQIKKTYKGQPGFDIALIHQPSGSKASDSISYSKGQFGIWFLSKSHKKTNNIYFANHPQRFWPKDKIPSLHSLIQSCSKQSNY